MATLLETATVAQRETHRIGTALVNDNPLHDTTEKQHICLLTWSSTLN